MKNDIIRPARRRPGRPKGPPIKKKTIDFYVYEAEAIKRYKQSKKQPYRTVLLDGLELLPGFSGILKQEKQKYDRENKRQEATGTSRSARAIEAEFGK